MFPLPILDLLLALVISVSAPAHPHNPKAFALTGAKGKATLSYLTLPYNPEAVKTLQPGTDWYLGGAQLNTQMDLTSGAVKIPAGSYQLNVRRADDGEFKQAVLKRAGADDIVLSIAAFAAEEEEHLMLRVINNGYVTTEMGGLEPADGAEFTILMSFGDMHRKLELKEVFEVGNR
jgi:hypothetical protein